MRVAVAKETIPGERRVALIPASVTQLTKVGVEVAVESGAGEEAGFSDASYRERDARIIDRDELFSADLVACVRSYGTSDSGPDGRFRNGQVMLGMCDPLGAPDAAAQLALAGVTLLSLELIPRITRAQSMDVLSSMATIAGYRAVLLASVELPKMFPMLMTAAGTLTPARVLVIGAGVAGLQAIATARRLGGVVQAYDVRPACREQVESLGAKFVELSLDTSESEGKGGYAKAMDEEFYVKQRAMLGEIVSECDVVVTTAAIPGKRSPLLIDAQAVTGMPTGGVIVDLAAERGGNCELSEPDQRIKKHGITILGPTNLPAEIPHHASQMFSNNVTKFLLNLVKDGKIDLNLEDEIIRDTLVSKDGDVINTRIRELLKLAPLEDKA